MTKPAWNELSLKAKRAHALSRDRMQILLTGAAPTKPTKLKLPAEPAAVQCSCAHIAKYFSMQSRVRKKQNQPAQSSQAKPGPPAVGHEQLLRTCQAAFHQGFLTPITLLLHTCSNEVRMAPKWEMPYSRARGNEEEALNP